MKGLSAVDLQSAWPMERDIVSSTVDGVRHKRPPPPPPPRAPRLSIAIVPEKDLAILADTSNRKMTCFPCRWTGFQRGPVYLRLGSL